MKMKKWILALCASGLATVASAQSVPQVAALDSATVYVQGAELLHRAQAQLTAGANTLRLSGVARTLDERSLRIDLPDGVNLLSVQQVGIDGDGAPLLGYAGNPEDRCLAVSIDSAKRGLEEIRNQLLAEEGTLALLDENQQLGGTAGGITIDELKRYIDYYKKERLATRGRIIALNAEQTRAQRRLDSLENVREIKQAERGGGGSQLELQLYAERAVTAPIAIRYITPLAGWSAFYDLRVSSISAPLSLVYKAQVRQHTGVDWKQVSLTLATGSPADGGTAPRFEPWFLHVMPPTPKPVYAPNADLTMKEDRVLEEVMVTSADQHAYAAIPMQVHERQLNLRFSAPVPYDIAANGKPHGVVLQTVSHPAQYRYYAAPKFNTDAFLMAEMTDYRKLNLLPGMANLIVENAYVGQSAIDPLQTGDTLRLSMGKDDRIAVRRTRVDEQQSGQWVGNQRTEAFTYEITVQNHKAVPIALTLEEPYPIAADDKVRVRLLETAGAENNTEKGILKWNLSLAPGASKTVRIGYEVRYPKGSRVNL